MKIIKTKSLVAKSDKYPCRFKILITACSNGLKLTMRTRRASSSEIYCDSVVKLHKSFSKIGIYKVLEVVHESFGVSINFISSREINSSIFKWRLSKLLQDLRLATGKACWTEAWNAKVKIIILVFKICNFMSEKKKYSHQLWVIWLIYVLINT
jgi:hypothetical protein